MTLRKGGPSVPVTRLEANRRFSPAGLARLEKNGGKTSG